MPISERIATELPATIKTTSYAVVDGDFGREIQFQSASALTAQLPSVLDVENGFNVVIRNIGPGALLIQPVSPELIDGNPSANLATGAWVWIRGDGTEWKSVASNATGTGTVTQIDTSGGLTGGPITNTGIISIADDGVTLTKMASGTAGNLISYDANGDPVAVATGNAGEVLTSQGLGLPPVFSTSSSGGGLQSMQVFTTSGTWTKPGGITRIKVSVVGGGGGGGGCAGGVNNCMCGASGGGGGMSIKLIDVSAISSVAVTVGAGGAGGATGANPGNTGGTSNFGTHCSATGGSGGAAGEAARSVWHPGAAGGVGTNGDLNLTGERAGFSRQPETGSAERLSANGGGSPLSFGGGRGLNADDFSANGIAATGQGCGGSGGIGEGSFAGGAGAAGIVIVEEYS